MQIAEVWLTLMVWSGIKRWLAEVVTNLDCSQINFKHRHVNILQNQYAYISFN